ncbi:class I SAM-dependent methyltransferase [Bradyrhizobium japonicum]|uniref:class I SAM-dependent methyltransferase n=1 Tax=Bradyrhizobium japonicum TaxID=375 RepID=UPI001BA5DB02|nr:class I SAM-dependent methyltransferase [Bradyrhizobium japonicum]MBR0909062.1 class I SAM-dependent methyltransferase [Bradyrhizobium japonicum]
MVERCSPAEVRSIDPSEGQLAFARTRPASRWAKFYQGDVMTLNFADSSFDPTVMADDHRHANEGWLGVPVSIPFIELSLREKR